MKKLTMFEKANLEELANRIVVEFPLRLTKEERGIFSNVLRFIARSSGTKKKKKTQFNLDVTRGKKKFDMIVGGKDK